MTLIDKIVHYIFLLLVGPVFKLVYLRSEVEKKVTLFCIISILGLLTHMGTAPYQFIGYLAAETFFFKSYAYK